MKKLFLLLCLVMGLGLVSCQTDQNLSLSKTYVDNADNQVRAAIDSVKIDSVFFGTDDSLRISLVNGESFTVGLGGLASPPQVGDVIYLAAFQIPDNSFGRVGDYTILINNGAVYRKQLINPPGTEVWLPSGIIDNQLLSLNGTNLSIENGNTVNLGAAISASLSGDNVHILNSVPVASFGDVGDFAIITSTKAIFKKVLQQPGAIEQWSFVSSLDAQLLSLNGTNLSIENGSTVNLAPLLEANAGEVQELTFANDSLGLTLSDVKIPSSSLFDPGTGWAVYGDNQYTESSPLVITQGQTRTIDINGLGTTLKTELPNGVTDFYNTSTSMLAPAASGDLYRVVLTFKGKTSTSSARMIASINVNTNVLHSSVILFPNSASAEFPFTHIFSFPASDIFVTNGGSIQILSDRGTSSLYDFSLLIERTYSSN